MKLGAGTRLSGNREQLQDAGHLFITFMTSITRELRGQLQAAVMGPTVYIGASYAPVAVPFHRD
jgi:hypothetical protein